MAIDGQPQASQPSKVPITERIAATREKTKEITAKVKSTLPSLKVTTHEQIYNLPNFLTATRLVAAPIVGYLVMHGELKWATILFAYAGITDLVDGWIARRWKLQTVVGSVIDPMADKGLMIILTVTLAAKGLLPAYLATLILGRDVALAIAAIYYRYASLPAPKTFRRYWDFSLPSAEVHPTTVSKYNTFLQILLIGATLALPVVLSEKTPSTVMSNLGISPDTLHSSMNYFQYLVVGTTAWSGLSYAYLKNAVTILGTNEELKAKQGARGRAIIGVLYGSVVFAAIWLFFTRRASAEPLPQGISVEGDRDSPEFGDEFSSDDEDTTEHVSDRQIPETSESARRLMDIQMQLMLLEQHNLRRILTTSQENFNPIPEAETSSVLDQRDATPERAAAERTERQEAGHTSNGRFPARTGVIRPIEGIGPRLDFRIALLVLEQQNKPRLLRALEKQDEPSSRVTLLVLDEFGRRLDSVRQGYYLSWYHYRVVLTQLADQTEERLHLAKQGHSWECLRHEGLDSEDKRLDCGCEITDT
ncbi:hypothetical protein MBLNU457_g0790t3 [Dothideomycetes sp. NU457]